MRCIVVGSGCSGLTCAIIMAKHGHSVTVVEKGPCMAPLMQGFERKRRYFDTGVHCLSGLGDNGPLTLLFEYLNIRNRLTYKPFAAKNSYTLHGPDGFVWNMPQGLEACSDSLAALFPQEAEGIAAFLKDTVALGEQFQYPVLNQATLDHPQHNQPMDAVLGRYVSAPQLKVCLSVFNTLFCGLVDAETSYGFFAASAGLYYQDSGTVEGGGRAICTGMLEELQGLGATVLFGNGVRSIQTGDRKQVTSVVLEDGAPLSCDCLIYTGHPALLPDLLPDTAMRDVRRAYYRELSSSMSLLGVYGTIDEPVDCLSGRNVIIAETAAPYDAVFSEQQGYDQRPMMVTGHAGHDGTTTFSIFVPSHFSEWEPYAGGRVHRRGAGYHERKDDVARQVMRKAQQYIPEMQGRATVVSVSTPLTIRDYCNAPEGAAYGIKHSLTQFAPTPSSPVRNMYLSGQGIAAPGIMGAMTAGFITCGEILGHDLLRGELQACS